MLTELLILKVLLDEECTIYRIKKKIELQFSLFYNASMGTIHPCLNKLHKAGQVSLKKFVTDGGQKRYKYSITPKGKNSFQKILIDSPLTEQIAKIKLLILPEMEKKLQLLIIKAIREYYQDRLLEFENYYETYPLNYIKHCINITSDEINWLKFLESKTD